MQQKLLTIFILMIFWIPPFAGGTLLLPPPIDLDELDSQVKACQNTQNNLLRFEQDEALFHGTYSTGQRLGNLRHKYNQLRLKYMIYDGLNQIQVEYKSYLHQLAEETSRSVSKTNYLAGKGLQKISKYVAIEKFMDFLMKKTSSMDLNPIFINADQLFNEFNTEFFTACQKAAGDRKKLCPNPAKNEIGIDTKEAVLGFYNAYINSSLTQEERINDLKKYKKALTESVPNMNDEFEHFLTTKNFLKEIDNNTIKNEKCAKNFNNLESCYGVEEKKKINLAFSSYRKTMFDHMNLNIAKYESKDSIHKKDFQKTFDKFKGAYIEERFGSLKDLANNIINKKKSLTTKIQDNYLIAQKRAALTQNSVPEFLKKSFKIPPLEDIYNEVFKELECVNKNQKANNFSDPKLSACLDKHGGNGRFEREANELMAKMKKIKNIIDNMISSKKYQKLQKKKVKLYVKLEENCINEKMERDRTSNECYPDINEEVIDFIKINEKIISSINPELEKKYLKKLNSETPEEKDTKYKYTYSTDKMNPRPIPLYKGQSYSDLNRDYFVEYNPTGGPPILTRKKNFLQLLTGALPETQLFKQPNKYMPLWAGELSGLNAGHIDRQLMFAEYGIQQAHYNEQIYNIQQMLNSRPAWYNPYADASNFGLNNPRVWPDFVYDYVNERGSNPLI